MRSVSLVDLALPRRLPTVAVVVFGAALSSSTLCAQTFDRGAYVPGVRLSIGLDPHDIVGETGPQILRQLQTSVGPAGLRTSTFFRWSYDSERIPRLNGTPSDQCRFTDFGLVVEFTLEYPRWAASDDIAPQLVEAWEAFSGQMEEQWARTRDDVLERGAEAVRQSRDYEDHCPLLAQRYHDVLIDLMDTSRPLPGRETLELPAYRWPPVGHEQVMNATDAQAEAEPEVAAPEPPTRPTFRTAGTVRPGRPRPLTTPAPDLDFAVQTDLRGTVPTGFVAGLHHQGELQYLNAFGTNGEAGEALTIETPLAIPSFTEVLLSTLADAMASAGILSLDAPISTYLDDLSPRLGTASLRQLLNHEAGLDNASPRDSTTAWDTVMDELDDRALFTDPGVLPSYSRYSLALATRVVERVAGTSLEDALQRTVLDPLGMTATSLGARDAETVTNGLPIASTSAADLLRFWYAWLDGNISGAGMEALPSAADLTLSSDGRAYRGGLWVDRPGAEPRLSLVCGTSVADAIVHIYPLTGTIVLAIGVDGWPRHTGTFLLDAVGRMLRIENEVFGPVRIDGVAGFGRRPRPCSGLRTTRTYRPVDFGPRAETGEWAGRYVNGEWFFALEDDNGLLTSPRPTEAGLPWRIHHFEGETHFASLDPTEREGVGFPFRLFVGPDGKRYLMLEDRAYVHEDDRTR